MSRWIPVAESLPDADLTVIIATDPEFHGEPVWLGYYDGDPLDGGKGWREMDGSPAFVTHWQDLPEPPGGAS